MNKEFAWVLGYLLSDGCINRHVYPNKGDKTHLFFICQYIDNDVLYKVKEILQTRANVNHYPNYSSPRSQLCVYDRKDIIKKYADIKTTIPSDIKDYERHFIRGLIDGNGTLSLRKARNSFRLGFTNEHEFIVSWVTKTICEQLRLPLKRYRFVPQSNIWEVLWEGNIARVIAYWLYHGDIEHCALKRKLDKYKTDVLDNYNFDSQDNELLYASKAIQTDNTILMQAPSNKTLAWAHILQNLLSFNTTPVCSNSGQRKYYYLHIPNRIANMQSTGDSEGIVH